MSVTEVRGEADAAPGGIWTNREVTGMKTVPRRLLLLGGGPVGVEMAQAVHRLGGEVALVNGAQNLLFHEARPLGEASPRSCARKALSFSSTPRPPPLGARAMSTSSTWTTATS